MTAQTRQEIVPPQTKYVAQEELPLPGRMGAAPNQGRYAAASFALPRFREHEGLKRYVWAFPLKSSPVVLVIGDGYWTILGSIEFSAYYRPSNTEGRQTWARHIKAQHIEAGLLWPSIASAAALAATT